MPRKFRATGICTYFNLGYAIPPPAFCVLTKLSTNARHISKFQTDHEDGGFIEALILCIG